MIYSKSIIATTFLCTALLSPLAANAQLTSVDFKCNRDGLITRDSATNLDWLDIPLTVNQTYDQVRTGVYYSLGFRHATQAEIQTLFINAGTPDDNFDISVTYPTETLALIALMGVTSSTAGNLSFMGFTGTDFFGNTITTSSHPIGTQFSALLGKANYMDLTASGLGLIGEAHFSGGQPFSDEADPTWGSFLVRPSAPITVGKCSKKK